MSRATEYSPEVRERAVRLVQEQLGEHASEAYGVESICAQLPIAPSVYDEHRRRRQDPGLRAWCGVGVAERRFRQCPRDCSMDRVSRQFCAERPDAFWVADISYVATWAGFVYVAFVFDVYALRIVGWRVMRSMQADLAPDALGQGGACPTSEGAHDSPQ